MNTFLEAFLSIAFGIFGNKFLKRYGFGGKMMSICILILSLMFFTFSPFMMKDIEGGDQYIPQSRENEDGLTWRVEGGPGSITYEDMYDGTTVAFRTVFSALIFFFGAFAIIIS